jgi:hypothetical protein
VTVSKSVEKDMAPKTTFDSNSDSSSDTSSVGDEDEVVTKKILTEKVNYKIHCAFFRTIYHNRTSTKAETDKTILGNIERYHPITTP